MKTFILIIFTLIPSLYGATIEATAVAKVIPLITISYPNLVDTQKQYDYQVIINETPKEKIIEVIF